MEKNNKYRVITWGQAGEKTSFKRVDDGSGLTEVQWGYVKVLIGLVALGTLLGAVEVYYPGGIHGAINFGVEMAKTTIDSGIGFINFITNNTHLASGTDFTDIATGPGSKMPGVFTP